jgi:hypothetical protein
MFNDQQYILDGTWLLGKTMCQIWTFVSYDLALVSAGHLVIIAVDRYRILFEGVAYLQRRSVQSVLEPVIWLWLIGFWIVSPFFIDWDESGNYYQKEDSSKWTCSARRSALWVMVASLTNAILPGLLMIRLYLAIYKKLKKRLRNKNAIQTPSVSAVTDSKVATDTEDEGHSENLGEIQEPSKREIETYGMALEVPQLRGHQNRQKLPKLSKLAAEKERRAAVTLGFLIFGFIFCFTPYVFMHAILIFFKVEPPRYLLLFAVILAWINSLINPVIYAVRNTDFKNAFKKIIRWICKIPFKIMFWTRT